MGKKLYRSTTNRQIAGVCGGLGEYFEVDPAIFRIIFILLFFGGSAGFWIYLIFSFVLPNDYEVTRKKVNPFDAFRSKTDHNHRKDVTPDNEPKESDWSDF